MLRRRQSNRILWRSPSAQEAGARVETLFTKDGQPARVGQRAYRKTPRGTMVLQSQTLNQQVQMGNAPLTSSPPAGRANLIRLQESVKHLVTSVTSGRRSGVFCRRLNPDGSWERTSQACLPLKGESSSVESSLTWPRWGMMLDGVLTGLLTWERGT